MGAGVTLLDKGCSGGRSFFSSFLSAATCIAGREKSTKEGAFLLDFGQSNLKQIVLVVDYRFLRSSYDTVHLV